MPINQGKSGRMALPRNNLATRRPTARIGPIQTVEGRAFGPASGQSPRSTGALLKGVRAGTMGGLAVARCSLPHLGGALTAAVRTSEQPWLWRGGIFQSAPGAVPEQSRAFGSHPSVEASELRSGVVQCGLPAVLKRPRTGSAHTPPRLASILGIGRSISASAASASSSSSWSRTRAALRNRAEAFALQLGDQQLEVRDHRPGPVAQASASRPAVRSARNAVRSASMPWESSSAPSVTGEPRAARSSVVSGARPASRTGRLPNPATIERWSGRRDLNPRPPVPQTDALPGCATARSLAA